MSVLSSIMSHHFFQRRSKADATKQSALESLQHSGQHDQLPVIHIRGNAVMSSLDKDCNSANARSKKEINDKTLDTTHGDILDPKSDDEDGGVLKSSSCLCETA